MRTPESFPRNRFTMPTGITYDNTVTVGDPRPASECEAPLQRVERKLAKLYGHEKGAETFTKLQGLIDKWKPVIPERPPRPEGEPYSQRDIALITYPDAFRRDDEPSLRTLKRFLHDHVGDAVNTVHILPFNPYTSDRGFSVQDYKIVDHKFGTWDDIQEISQEYDVVADIVLGHISAQSHEFQEFKNGNPEYQDYFIWWTPEEVQQNSQLQADLKKVRRPRVTPLLTEFDTVEGPKMVWTTFSVNGTTDQVDVNYGNPQVLLDKIEVMMRNLHYGVSTFRMDALTYVWKELGTECASLPQNYAILDIFKNILKEVSPNARLLTETNVPHAENISYFGDGENGADQVYNFAEAPLTVDAYRRKKADRLTRWAKTLGTPSDKNTFFNFLGSHDGIGVLGARGVIPDEDIDALPEFVASHGGKISTKRMPNGSEAVYEMNSTWWSALNGPHEYFDIALKRHITSHAMMFALKGMPAVYYHSFLGSENDLATWNQTHTNRDINEQKFDYDALDAKLRDPNSREHIVSQRMRDLMEYRAAHPALSPMAPQEILDLDDRVFAVRRSSDKGDLLALHNVSDEPVALTYNNIIYILDAYGFQWTEIESSVAHAAA